MFGLAPLLFMLFVGFLAFGMLELAAYGFAFFLLFGLLMLNPNLVALIIALFVLKKVLD